MSIDYGIETVPGQDQSYKVAPGRGDNIGPAFQRNKIMYPGEDLSLQQEKNLLFPKQGEEATPHKKLSSPQHPTLVSYLPICPNRCGFVFIFQFEFMNEGLFVYFFNFSPGGEQ